MPHAPRTERAKNTLDGGGAGRFQKDCCVVLEDDSAAASWAWMKVEEGGLKLVLFGGVAFALVVERRTTVVDGGRLRRDDCSMHFDAASRVATIGRTVSDMTAVLCVYLFGVFIIADDVLLS